MIEAQYVGVTVHRSELHEVSKKVLAHEVPIMAARFGRGNINTRSLSDTPEHRLKLNPETEYRRLVRKYGNDQTGTPWVTSVYGHPFDSRFEDSVRKGGTLVNAPLQSEDADVETPENAADPLD